MKTPNEESVMGWMRTELDWYGIPYELHGQSLRLVGHPYGVYIGPDIIGEWGYWWIIESPSGNMLVRPGGGDVCGELAEIVAMRDREGGVA
jgi:hypothetical protein